MAGSVRIVGLRELTRDLGRADKELARELRRELREAAKIVSLDARERFSPIDPSSAMGIQPRVRSGGLAVAEQRRKRTTGKHPEFGKLQMRRALLPALSAKRDEVEKHMEEMLDRLGRDLGF